MERVVHSKEGKRLTRDLSKSVSSPNSDVAKDSGVKKLGWPQLLSFSISHLESHISQQPQKLWEKGFLCISGQ